MIDLSEAPTQRQERFKPEVDGDPVEAFRSAMANCGLVPEHIDTSGSLIRIDVDKPGDKAGWYVFYQGDICAGAFGNWRTDLNEKWCSKDRRAMSDAESAEYSRMAAEAKRLHAENKAILQAAAKVRAKEIWDAAEPVFIHQYLTKKGVQSHGLKQSRGSLIVPMKDEQGEIHSLQFIRPDGVKKFLFGGRVEGLSFTIPGNEALGICEGYATGATLNQATGATIVCAFNAGNVPPVAKAVRSSCLSAPITIYADNDRFTAGNPGIEKATKAAKAISGKVVFPVFDGLPGADDPVLKLSDFNDLASVGGLELVAQQAKAPAQRGKLLPLTKQTSLVRGRLLSRPKNREFIFRFNESGLIPKGVVGVLAAEGGTGKTHFLLSLAISGAFGGNFGPINAPRPLSTLIILCEDDQDELDRRLWDIGKGVFPENLYAVSVYGEMGPLMRLEGSNPVLGDAWYWLDETLDNHDGLELLVLDPKSRIYGLDENNNDHATQWIQCLEVLAKKHCITILFSHHTGKGNSNAITQSMGRGASAIVDGCRWQGGLIRMDNKTAEKFCIDNPRDYVLFDAPKSNYAADLPAAICFKRGDGGVLQYCEPGCEIRQEMSDSLLDLITMDVTRYSKNDLIKQPVGLGIARDMKSKFPGFIRSKDMKNVIESLLRDVKLFEVDGENDTAGKPKKVLSVNPF